MHTLRRSTVLLVLLALAGSVSGCALRLPQFSLGQNEAYSPEAGQMPSAAPAGTPQVPAVARPQSRPANSIAATFKKAARSVGDALTIKPKVIHAHDPTSLTTETGPIGPDLYISAAQLTENRRDFESARLHYERALEIDENCLPALIGLGRLYHRLGKMDLAVLYSQRAVEAHPDSPMARNDLGLCYARMRQFQPAVESLSVAVQLKPDSTLFRNNLAAALTLAGRNNEALMHLSQVHSAAVANYNLGYLLFKQGKMTEARNYFQRALQADPQLLAAAQLLMRVRAQMPAGEAPPPAPPAMVEPPASPATPQSGELSPEASCEHEPPRPGESVQQPEVSPPTDTNFAPILTPEEALRRGLNEPTSWGSSSDSPNGHLDAAGSPAAQREYADSGDRRRHPEVAHLSTIRLTW